MAVRELRTSRHPSEAFVTDRTGPDRVGPNRRPVVVAQDVLAALAALDLLADQDVLAE